MDKTKVLDTPIKIKSKPQTIAGKRYISYSINIPKIVREEIGLKKDEECAVSYKSNLKERYVCFSFVPLTSKEFLKYHFKEKYIVKNHSEKRHLMRHLGIPDEEIFIQKKMFSSNAIISFRNIQNLKKAVKDIKKAYSKRIQNIEKNVKKMEKEYKIKMKASS